MTYTINRDYSKTTYIHILIYFSINTLISFHLPHLQTIHTLNPLSFALCTHKHIHTMAMNSSKAMLTLLFLIMSIAISLSIDESHVNIKKDNANEHLLTEGEDPSFTQRKGRFLAQQVKAVSTCDVYPKLCRRKNSSGPNCCNKQCVNLMTDKLNCGKCGKKCNYSEMCCQGDCVNPSSDERDCGRCNKKCSKGSSCEYGLCSYA